MKQSTPPLIKHRDHQIEMRPTRPESKHAAIYHCVDCNKWVAWVSKADAEQAKRLGLFK